MGISLLRSTSVLRGSFFFDRTWRTARRRRPPRSTAWPAAGRATPVAVPRNTRLQRKRCVCTATYGLDSHTVAENFCKILTGVIQIDDPHLCLFVDDGVRAEYDDPDAAAHFAVDMVNEVVLGFEEAGYRVVIIDDPDVDPGDKSRGCGLAGHRTLLCGHDTRTRRP